METYGPGYIGVDWKAAGADADDKAIACAIAGRHLFESKFKNIDKCYLTMLFTVGCMFRRLSDSKFVVSLGYRHMAAFAWVVEQLEPGLWLLSRDSISLQEARNRVVEICINKAAMPDETDDHYEAIPTTPCFELSCES